MVVYQPDAHSKPQISLPSAMVGPEGPTNGSNHSVRFASHNLEIDPSGSVQTGTTGDAPTPPPQVGRTSSGVGDEFRNLSLGMQKSRLQERRLHNFAFDPVSLPASRVRITTLRLFQGTRE